MAHSSELPEGDVAILKSQYNNLRKDVLDASTGHAHTGAEDDGVEVIFIGQAKATGDVTTTGSWQDVPGASFSAPESKDYFLHIAVDISKHSHKNPGDCRARVSVDGNTSYIEARASGIGEYSESVRVTTTQLVYVEGVTSGETIKMQVYLASDHKLESANTALSYLAV